VSAESRKAEFSCTWTAVCSRIPLRTTCIHHRTADPALSTFCVHATATVLAIDAFCSHMVPLAILPEDAILSLPASYSVLSPYPLSSDFRICQKESPTKSWTSERWRRSAMLEVLLLSPGTAPRAAAVPFTRVADRCAFGGVTVLMHDALVSGSRSQRRWRYACH
jgi:hypothetical protein